MRPPPLFIIIRTLSQGAPHQPHSQIRKLRLREDKTGQGHSAVERKLELCLTPELTWLHRTRDAGRGGSQQPSVSRRGPGRLVAAGRLCGPGTAERPLQTVPSSISGDTVTPLLLGLWGGLNEVTHVRSGGGVGLGRMTGWAGGLGTHWVPRSGISASPPDMRLSAGRGRTLFDSLP